MMLELDITYPEELMKDPISEAKIRGAEKKAAEIVAKAKEESVKIMDKARAEADRLRKKHPGRVGMEMATAHLEQQAEKVKQMLKKVEEEARKLIENALKEEEHKKGMQSNIQAAAEKMDNLLAKFLQEYDSLQNQKNSEKKQIRVLKKIKYYSKMKTTIFELKDLFDEVRDMQEALSLLGDMTTSIGDLLNMDTQFNEKNVNRTMKTLKMQMRKMEKLLDRTLDWMDTMMDPPEDNIFVRIWNWITGKEKNKKSDAQLLEEMKNSAEMENMLSVARASAQNNGGNGATGGAPSGTTGGNTTTFSGGTTTASGDGGSGIDGIGPRPTL